jgi:hypothetical protein
VYARGIQWEPIYCGNCCVEGGKVPVGVHNFAFWLCNKCEHFGEVAGMMRIPDEVFWAKAQEAQLEAYGRELSFDEQVAQLNDDNSILAKLARDHARKRG